MPRINLKKGDYNIPNKLLSSNQKISKSIHNNNKTKIKISKELFKKNKTLSPKNS
jgi:hypothetical protein